MAKDPAFLFYPTDFIIGTQFMTDSEIGQYIKVLCAIHQHGRLTKDQVNAICNGNATASIWHKLKADEDGLYYNQRLDVEITKRAKHAEKQRLNANKRWHPDATAYATAMPLINRDINTNENKNEGKKKEQEKKFTPPTLADVTEYFISKGFPKQLADRAFEYYDTAGWRDSKGNLVRNWKQKMIANWLKPENKNISTGTQSTYKRDTPEDLATYLKNTTP